MAASGVCLVISWVGVDVLGRGFAGVCDLILAFDLRSLGCGFGAGVCLLGCGFWVGAECLVLRGVGVIGFFRGLVLVVSWWGGCSLDFGALVFGV